MRNSIKGALAVAALAGLGLASNANAAIIEVRAADGSKAVTVGEGGSVTLKIYVNLSGITTDGLQAFNVSLRTGDGDLDGRGEYYGTGTPGAWGGGTLWPIAPSPADTPVNASASSMVAGADFKDGSWSNGTITDLVGNLTPKVDQNDTDIDMKSMSGTQGNAGNLPFVPGYAKTGEFLIGTVTFTAPDLDDIQRGTWRQVLVNAFYTNLAAANGGADIRGFVGTTIGANLINSQSVIGQPVLVTVVVPEPATIGVMGAAGLGLGLIRRRRHVHA